MSQSWKQVIQNKFLLSWIEDVVALTEPEDVFVCSGSEEEYHEIASLLVKKGSFVALNSEKRPSSFLARSDSRDVARVEDRTFICAKNKEDVGITNNWEDPDVMRKKLKGLFSKCMKGRILYVIPFSMAPLTSPFSMIGIELTDSPYVVCSMSIMTHMGSSVLKKLGNENNFIRCLHSVGYPLEKGQQDIAWPCDPENTCIAHFQDDCSIWSYGSGYGGNALLGKKCLALRIASFKAKTEGWLAEHMLIVSVTSPKGEKKYFVAAFPSACGKTNLAMLQSKLPGWQVQCVGDDIAWLRFSSDGQLYAINPEFGFFGVAPGTSEKTNPNAMEMSKKHSIFTNVAETKDGDVWWEGMTTTPPKALIDWLGHPWDGTKGKPAAHPNSRFTVPLKQCPCLDDAWNDEKGVPISGIIFGGRRTSTIPLVFEALSWSHGVLLGAGMSSESTTASVGEVGKLRHDPFAMLPFCGYNMGDYFSHWLNIKKDLPKEKLPKMFFVNWFRKDSEGKFLWPGFGENMRVLKWIFERCNNDDTSAKTTAIGIIPGENALNVKDLNLAPDVLRELFSINPQEWKKEFQSIREYLEKFGSRIPKILMEELNEREKQLAL